MEPPSTATTTTTASDTPPQRSGSRAAERAESDEEPEEMSPFQKQLMAKRQGRVALKSKKVMALMEEETIIGDPHAKVKLIKHQKQQVWFINYY